MAETFGVMLRRYRERVEPHLSCNRLANRIGVNPSYLLRICNGERRSPGDHIVDALARELRLTLHEWDELRMAAGYSPQSVNGSGWSPALHLVAQVLNDPMLTPEDRAAFEATVRNIAEHWRAAKVEGE